MPSLRPLLLAQDPGDIWNPELSPEGKAEFSRKSTRLGSQETQTVAFHEADPTLSSSAHCLACSGGT